MTVPKQRQQDYTAYCQSIVFLRNKYCGIESSQKSEQQVVLTTLLRVYITSSEALRDQLLVNQETESYAPLLRTMFETFLNLKYLLIKEPVSLETKVGSYLFCEAKNYLAATDYLYYQSRQEQLATPEIGATDQPMPLNLEAIDAERVQRLQYLNAQKQTGITAEYYRLKNHSKRQQVSWYSLFTELSSIKALSEYVGLTGFYHRYYPYLALTSHGLGLLRKAEKSAPSILTQEEILYYGTSFTTELLSLLPVVRK